MNGVPMIGYLSISFGSNPSWSRIGKSIADNLSKAGWSWGCVLALDVKGRTIWIADAHRGDGKRFVIVLRSAIF